MKLFPMKRLWVASLTAIAVSGASLALPVAPGFAEDLLQESGSLAPANDEYTFSGTAGQSITITMTSDEFDTVIELLDAQGQQVAFNDDYARTLNSTIVTTLPRTGTYKVLARSFSGAGGRYVITVRASTPYDQSYSQAWTLYMESNYDGAIAAFGEAIELDPNQPAAYADRAEARWGEFYASLGESYDYENPPPTRCSVESCDRRRLRTGSRSL
ncbi:MAG: tetratricopeptide repeat protein [Leptolyngbyaceae cyanobacterium SL_7_1]|nr:tetratricopeptide repeat protein [Leptolyngbyaceae cyanobacterium SL_7_1]